MLQYQADTPEDKKGKYLCLFFNLTIKTIITYNIEGLGSYRIERRPLMVRKTEKCKNIGALL